MPVGGIQSLGLKLDYMGHRFLPGQKIRIALSTAYWPFIWPATNNPILTLANKPTRLSLPLRTKQNLKPVQVDPPVAPPASTISTKRTPKSKRAVKYDLHQDKTTLTIEDDLGEIIYKKHNLATSAAKYESYEIHTDDPLSSKAHIIWKFEYGRGKWAVRTVTETKMTCDKEHYFLTAIVRAYELEKIVFEKTFSKKVLRVG
jgi:hypothetical protein